MSLSSCERPLVDGYDAVVLDLDGVVYVSSQAVPEAVPVLNRVTDAGVPLAYVTNNAARTPQEVAGQLRSLGLKADDDDVITSAQAIARVMAAELPAGSPVLVAGGAGLRVAVQESGLSPAADLGAGPVAVVQGYFPQIGWEDLAEIAYAVEAGLPWYVSNTDLTIPTSRGIAPGNGSLVQAVQNAARVPPRAIAGKPHRPLFEVTLERLGAANALMVGDRLDTDIAGARGAGLTSLAVLTGVSTLADIAAATGDDRPDFVAADLRGLFAPHPPVTVDDVEARCGAARALLTGEQVGLERRSSQSVENLRAVLGLAWSIRDRSGTSPRLDGTLGP
ncbi:HAD-IIA family hydrolase [Aeromicrobium phragmitis]|uniref:HAD-IIA family hydrolase n=1 Tax=Aeromicrobium phragmitis TaxID=2478914 RepID=A0A3L8PJG0_9ACTN|nr:HAD-IIA family hydrolase [Aeromicrobium phragmitis]RLV55475.1 HAD-IIA family hydrolase [Aeromicrobium phragmitis]